MSSTRPAFGFQTYQSFLILIPLERFSDTHGPLLRILCQNLSEDQKRKGHHFETIDNFVNFVPKVD